MKEFAALSGDNSAQEVDAETGEFDENASDNERSGLKLER
jgi:hypothetical protein